MTGPKHTFHISPIIGASIDAIKTEFHAPEDTPKYCAFFTGSSLFLYDITNPMSDPLLVHDYHSSDSKTKKILLTTLAMCVNQIEGEEVIEILIGSHIGPIELVRFSPSSKTENPVFRKRFNPVGNITKYSITHIEWLPKFDSSSLNIENHEEKLPQCSVFHNPNSTKFAFTTSNGEFFVFDSSLSDEHALRFSNKPQHKPQCFQLHETTQSLANPICLWQLTPSKINHFAFSGRFLAAAGHDGWLRVFDVWRGKLLVSFQSFYSSILRVQFSPCNRYILAASQDDRVTLYEWRGIFKYRSLLQAKLKTKSSENTGRTNNSSTNSLGPISIDGQIPHLGHICHLSGLSSWPLDVKFDPKHCNSNQLRIGAVSANGELVLWRFDVPKESSRKTSYSQWKLTNELKNEHLPNSMVVTSTPKTGDSTATSASDSTSSISNLNDSKSNSGGTSSNPKSEKYKVPPPEDYYLKYDQVPKPKFGVLVRSLPNSVTVSLDPISIHQAHFDASASLCFVDEGVITICPAGDMKMWGRPYISNSLADTQSSRPNSLLDSTHSESTPDTSVSETNDTPSTDPEPTLLVSSTEE